MFATKDQIKHLGRLKKRSDFLRVQGAGKKWVSTGMIVQLAPNENGEKRYGVTVTKKFFKNATDRNRIKRRLRAVACDTLTAHLPFGHDIVLIGREATLQRPYELLCQDLQWCLKKLAGA